MKKPQSGLSLILVLVMLAALGLGAAAALQSAASTLSMGSNTQATAQAQLQAEAALRFCENELIKADELRQPFLQEQAILTTAYQAAAQWTQAAAWQAAQNLSLLPGAWPGNALAQCVVERSTLADDRLVYVVTARAFGAGAQAGSRQTVVWVQSTLVLGTP